MRMLRKRRRKNCVGVCSESLEQRALLSATLADGVLSVAGTEASDRISVQVDGEELVAFINGESSRFAAADVTAVVIDAGDGDDKVSLRGLSIDATIHGGAGNDRIHGGDGRDVISGGDGADRISGLGGDDLIDGGAGRDQIRGDDGNDVISGGDANDRIDGGRGDDDISGDSGNDLLRGHDGNDVLNGGDGRDRLYGGRGEDILNGDAGNDRLYGQADADLVNGGDGDDTLGGDAAEDMLDGGDGENVIRDGDGARAEFAPDRIGQRIAGRSADLFGRLDANSDGTITEDEVTEGHWDRLSAADADSDGAVTADELMEQSARPFGENVVSEMRARRGRFAGDGARAMQGGEVWSPERVQAAIDRIRSTIDNSELPDGVTVEQAEARITQLQAALETGVRPEGERPEGVGGRPAGMAQGTLDRTAQIDAVFARFDANLDGDLTADEVPEIVWTRLSAADTDLSGSVSRDELTSALQSAAGRRPTGRPGSATGATFGRSAGVGGRSGGRPNFDSQELRPVPNTTE